MAQPRRMAMPLRVHQIWDAIARFSTSQIMDFDKLQEVVASMHKVPKEELNQELNYAIKDGLVCTEAVETQRREETEIYKLPDVEALEKGDHDWYCFQCHFGGPVVKCEDCPRVYHLDCLTESRKPDKDLFICPACHIMSTKPSVEKTGLKTKALNQLIMYIVARFRTWSSTASWIEEANGAKWAQSCNRSEKEAWRYKALVFIPIDLNTMHQKAESSSYQSLEEFQVDCETMIHAIGVYFGVEALKGPSIGAAFSRETMHDIQEIKLCHMCFRRSNEKDNDEWWFCLPCTPPHDVVWAKQTGYPFWPAKVMKREGNKYDVRYFGGNYERGNIDAKNIKPIDTPHKALKVRQTAPWNDANDELLKFQELAKDPNFVLPARKAGSVTKKGGNKRPASSAVETVSKKRKSEPALAVANAATPSKTPPKKTAASAKAVLKSKDSPKSNGTSSPQLKKKGTAPSKSGASTRRDSAKEAPVSSVKGKRTSAAGSKVPRFFDTSIDDDNLDPELRNFLKEGEDESLEGEVCFSDEESSESNDKVSEDAVSSSCNDTKSTRHAYVQVYPPGWPASKDINLERLSSFFTKMKEQHKSEMDLNKKKQWCYNCGREAIYHCCWNTAYCSIECQQMHWTTEHKRLCRRKKAP